MGVLAGSDPERFRASLASVGEVFVLLTRYAAGENEGAYFLALGGAGVAPVDPSTDALSFPGFGESATRFVGALKTVDAVLAVAKGSGCSA